MTKSMTLKTAWLAGLAAIMGIAGGSGSARAEIKLGDKAPEANVKMKRSDGGEITIASAAGKKGTLLIFTCNSCPWAKAWQGRVVEIGNTFSKKGIGVLAINSNDPKSSEEDRIEASRERARQSGMEFPYVIDDTSNVARAFGATKTPEAYLFDSSGRLVYHGAIDDNAKEPDKVTKHFLKDALTAVTEGKKVPLAETKALGCGIKFRDRS